MQFLLDWGIGLVVFGTDYRFKTFHMDFIFAYLSEAQIKWKFNPHEHFHLYCIIIMQCQICLSSNQCVKFLKIYKYMDNSVWCKSEIQSFI